MHKRKTLVYPYDIEFSPILRHSEILTDYNITSIVSPAGWGMSGRDAAIADGGNRLNINISSDFDASLALCDTVIFSASERELDFERYILPKAARAAEQGKDIVCLREFDKEVKKILVELCNKYGVDLKLHSDWGNKCTFEKAEALKLNKINTPVIFVAGIYERTQKFEIQLSLRELFSSLGYKVSQVGSRNYCELLGFHSFPDFMYNNAAAEKKKILSFNHYLKEIENKENPDVLIIGIPGGVMRLNDNFTGEFGITAYEVAQAVTPDAAVLSTFYEVFPPEYFEKIGLSMKYKLGFDVSCFNLSNAKFDWDVAKDIDKESYLLLDSSFIDRTKIKYDMLKTPVFNILNNEDRTKMANHLIDILSYFGEVESI
jgi:peptide maturation system protein (TIGR04066 family)